MFDFASSGQKSQNTKAPSQRQLKVGEEIRHALSEILLRGDVHHPDLVDSSITVSEVRVSPDLRNATAYIAPLGGQNKERILKALGESCGEIRHQVTRKIVLKFSPRISFRLDNSFDEANRINSLLHSPDVKRDISTPATGQADD
jgi:ribosome-binding factor A